jgi:hypothetical protein
MSLIRLLTAGKSWVGMPNEPIRYRMTDPRAMPKFGSEKNPFERKASSPAAAVAESLDNLSSDKPGAIELVADKNDCHGSETCAPEQEQGQGLCEAQRVEKVCGLDRRNADALRLTESRSDAGPEPSPDGSRASAPAPRETGKSGQWLNGLKAVFRRRPRNEARTDRFQANAAVQGELSLDNIKVMRNDLSDTDIEIVRAKRAGDSSAVSKEKLRKEQAAQSDDAPALTETVPTRGN